MNEIMKYQWEGEEITLTAEEVKKYISTDERVTDKEVFMFMKLCEAQKLNPFVKEAYLIKYGTSPATMVVGKETFLKRAEISKDFDGYELTEIGKIPDYSVSCKVYRKNLTHPIMVTVDYTEYVGTDKEGNINRMWKGKPKTMLRKVALMQALREAFPTALGGLYEETELDQKTKPIIEKERTEKAVHSECKDIESEENKIEEISTKKEIKIEEIPEVHREEEPEDTLFEQQTPPPEKKPAKGSLMFTKESHPKLSDKMRWTLNNYYKNNTSILDSIMMRFNYTIESLNDYKTAFRVIGEMKQALGVVAS